MIKRTITYTITNEYKGTRLGSYLKELRYPESILTKLRKEEGALLINGVPVHMNHILLNHNNEEVLSVIIFEDESSEKILPIELPLSIVYEDEDLLVLNKPAFMPIHPSLNNYENTLANAVAYYFSKKKEPFIFRCINRLDRDTSGLTILAKHCLSAGILSQDMQQRKIHREYTALAEGPFDTESGTIDYPIGRVDNSLITRQIDYEKGEPAITHYKVIEFYPDRNLTLLKLNLETGRTHQIRVHLKAIGHPLAGDFLYNPESTQLNRQALHAGHIEFTHPVTGALLSFTVSLPEDMQNLI